MLSCLLEILLKWLEILLKMLSWLMLRWLLEKELVF
jgi:hypothetical protein